MDDTERAELSAQLRRKLDAEIAAAIAATPSPEEQYARKAKLAVIDGLIAARLERRLSQAELAAKSGLPQSVIARLEKAESNPSLKTLQRYALALGKNLTISDWPPATATIKR